MTLFNFFNIFLTNVCFIKGLSPRSSNIELFNCFTKLNANASIINSNAEYRALQHNVSSVLKSNASPASYLLGFISSLEQEASK